MEFIHQQYMDDEELRRMYRRAKLEGIDKRVFVDNAFETAEAWVKYVRTRCWLVQIMYDDDPLEPFGVFWLDGFNGTVACFHYWVFMASWGKVNPSIAEEVFNWLKKNIGDDVKHLIGMTPKTNRLAVRVLRMAGFEEVKELEEAVKRSDGRYESMIISHRRL